jgi:hypothetical protein
MGAVTRYPPIAVIIKRDVLNHLAVQRIDRVERRGAVLVVEEAVVHVDACVSQADDLTLPQEARCKDGGGSGGVALLREQGAFRAWGVVGMGVGMCFQKHAAQVAHNELHLPLINSGSFEKQKSQSKIS